MAAEQKNRKLHQKTIVNSWNEWDPLKHVIIGRAGAVQGYRMQL
jgi:hypothetical protein